MNQFNQQHLAIWIDRFSSFYDSVIVGWLFEYKDKKTLSVTLELPDEISPSGWSRVILKLDDVKSMSCCDTDKASYQVLYGALHVLQEQNLIALDFGYFDDPPESLKELVTSPCHVVAKSLEWDVIHVIN
jgi:hypothetical protein